MREFRRLDSQDREDRNCGKDSVNTILQGQAYADTRDFARLRLSGNESDQKLLNNSFSIAGTASGEKVASSHGNIEKEWSRNRRPWP